MASLYVHHVLRREPTRDPVEAAALGARVPRTLPGVLELELRDDPALRPVLTAVAHARADGMPLAVVEALAPHFGAAGDVLPVLRRARFYLRGSAERDGTSLYRLFHQGLADQLRREDAEGEVFERLLPGSWAAAPLYTRRHAVQHAASAGRVAELLGDAGFLVHADPATLLPEAVTSGEPGAAVYLASAARHPLAGPAERRQLLAVDAARLGAGELAARLSQGLPFRVRWATGGQVHPAQRLALPFPGVRGPAPCPDRPGAFLAGTSEGRWALWDAANGARLGAPFGRDGPDAGPVACARLGERVVAAVGGHGDALEVWDTATGEFLAGFEDAHGGGVHAVDCAELDGRTLAVTGGADGAVRVWDLDALAEDPRRAPGPPGEPVAGVACLRRGGTVWAVAAGVYGTVRAWDLTGGRRVATVRALDDYTAVNALAACEVGGSPVALLAVGRIDGGGAVVLADLGGSGRIEPVLLAPGAEVGALACDGTVLLAGDVEGTLWAGGLDGGRAALQARALTGHGGRITAVAAARAAGRTVAVTGGADGTVRIWDPAAAPPAGRRLPAHPAAITAAAAVPSEGGDLVVAGGRDGTVQARSPGGDPLPRLEPPQGGAVGALAHGDFGGRRLLLAADGRRLVAWDPGGGPPVAGARVTAAAVACVQVGAGTVAIAVDGDGALRLWHPLTGRWGRVLNQDGSGTAPFAAIAACSGPGGRAAVVTLDGGGAVRVWDPATARGPGRPLGSGGAAAIGCARADRRAIAVTGGLDGTVRGWDLATAAPLGPARAGHAGAVTAVAFPAVDGRVLAVTAGTDATVRVWDPGRGAPRATLALPAPVQALAAARDGTLIAAMNRELVALTLRNVVFDAESASSD